MQASKEHRIEFRRVTARVPLPVVAYAVLGLVDLGFTLMAFGIGFREANPLLSWYQEQGTFEAAKLFSTIAVICLGFFLWKMPLVRWIILIADGLMALVVFYHLSFWLSYLLK